MKSSQFNNSKILVIDDDESIRDLMDRILKRQGHEVVLASSGEEGIDKLQNFFPNLIILDHEMEGMNGLETLTAIRQSDQYVSVLFVTAHKETEKLIETLESGADDYITKPFNTKELLARVQTNLRINDLTIKLRTANEKLQALVEIDDLTGLFNMRAAYKKIDFELLRGQRFNESISLLMLDMDHFKLVNDNHDHLFGSFVLSEVGAILKKNIRAIDFGIRFGGDEFIVCMTNTTFEGTATLCERLRSKIAEYLFKKNDDEMHLTVSIGFATSVPGSDIIAKNLLRVADHSLYQAKEEGRNRVIGYDESVEKEIFNKLKI